MEASPKSVDYIALGKKIRKVRQLRGLTQERLAEACGIISSYIGVIERAEKKPSVSTLTKVANALNVSMDYLLFDSLELKPHRIYDINGDTAPIKTTETANNIAASNGEFDTLKSLLNRVSSNEDISGKKEEITLILQILNNITSNYKGRS